jgi:hypothetical protein
MFVTSVALRDPQKIIRIAKSLGTLFDTNHVQLDALQFWPYDSRPGPLFVRCYLIIMRPDPQYGPYTVCKTVIGRLQLRHGVLLDWAAGTRKSGVWLLTKSRALDTDTLKFRSFRPDTQDFKVLRDLIPGAHRDREREIVRDR